MSTEPVTDSPGPLRWFKSTYSGSGGGDCVELAATSGTVRVRDSKNADGAMLRFSSEAWSAFISLAGAQPGVGD